MRSFIGNVTPGWLEAQYLLWKESPERVSHEWRLFFQGVEVGLGTTSDREPLAPELALKQSGVHALIHRYRDIGHLLACTDPLSACSTCHPLLEPEVFGLDEGDMERVFRVRNFVKSDATLREIVEVMRETYCRSIGVEFMHIQEHLEREWLIERMETARNRPQLSLEKRLSIQGKLLQTTLFEAFLNRKFPGETRFSLEGGETLIPMLDEIVTSAATHAITDIVLGMSHRGRLSVQATILGRAYENIFAEFGENAGVGFAGDGDVRYHSGFSADLDLADGSSVHLSLAPNPSHLEAIDPVVEGKCRARQDRHGDSGAKKVLPLLIHGDAAFAGQGIVAETLNMSRLEGYGTGGTFHIVLNNQIGFTTAPSEARST
ncbi:MAG: thiamine pyrophosphate-dependent enzyme, partial [Deltaproteobacteria bacterium]